MDVMFTHYAGLDVHKKTVMACRVTPDLSGQQADGIMELQEFGTMTRERSAGVVGLVGRGGRDACRHGKHWGLLASHLQPPGRHFYGVARECCSCEAGAVAQDRQGRCAVVGQADALRPAGGQFHSPAGAARLAGSGALSDQAGPRAQPRSQPGARGIGGANIKLAAVATDIMGVSGRAILAALVTGRADPATMAELAKGRMRTKLPLLAQALTGLMRDHHRRLLTLQLAHIDFLDEQIDAVSIEIMCSLTELEPRGAVTPPSARAEAVGEVTDTVVPREANSPLSFAQAVTVLDTIPGVDQRGAELLVAEWGTDMSCFGTASRLSAWTGVAPGNADLGETKD
jgi:transposase